MGEEQSLLEITPIQTPRKGNVLAEFLREKILSNKLREGDLLPSERELVEKSGISRGSVREALSLLEADSLITTRPGRNGGATVRRPGPTIMTKPVQLLIRGRQLPFQSVVEIREALEPSAARLAAQHRTVDDLQAIEAACEELEANLSDVDSYLRANMKWHMAIVNASHNDLLIGFMTALVDVIHAATKIEEFNTPESRTAVARAHRRITDAIRSGDADAAKRRMERHVTAYSEKVTPLAPETIAIGAK